MAAFKLATRLLLLQAASMLFYDNTNILVHAASTCAKVTSTVTVTSTSGGAAGGRAGAATGGGAGASTCSRSTTTLSSTVTVTWTHTKTATFTESASGGAGDSPAGDGPVTVTLGGPSDYPDILPGNGMGGVYGNTSIASTVTSTSTKTRTTTKSSTLPPSGTVTGTGTGTGSGTGTTSIPSPASPPSSTVSYVTPTTSAGGSTTTLPAPGGNTTTPAPGGNTTLSGGGGGGGGGGTFSPCQITVYTYAPDSDCANTFDTAGACGFSTYFKDVVGNGMPRVAMPMHIFDKYGASQHNTLCAKTVTIKGANGYVGKALVADRNTDVTIDLCMGLWGQFGYDSGGGRFEAHYSLDM